MFNDPFFNIDIPGINALNFDGLGASATLRSNMPASHLNYSLNVLRSYQNGSGRDLSKSRTRYPDVVETLPGEDGIAGEDDGLEIDQATGKVVSKSKSSLPDLTNSITSKGLLIAGVVLLLVGLALLK